MVKITRRTPALGLSRELDKFFTNGFWWVRWQVPCAAQDQSIIFVESHNFIFTNINSYMWLVHSFVILKV